MLPVMLVALLITGCIRDGEPDCSTKALLYVVVDADPSRLSPDLQEQVENATVYIFGPDSMLERVVTLNARELANRTPVEVMLHNGSVPRVVVWGNLNGAQDVTDPVPGMLLSSARIKMLKEGDFNIAPDKLYYGLKALTTETTQEVVISSWVGRIFITVRGLEGVRNNAGDYYFTIESKYDGYDFYGKPLPGDALLRIDAEASDSQQYELLVHQPVNLIAYPVIPGERQSMTVRLYKKTDTGDILLATAFSDVDGRRIVTHPGQNTNVLLDFTSGNTVEVYIVMTRWNLIHEWTTW